MSFCHIVVLRRWHGPCCMQKYVEVAVFAKKLTKDRVSVTIDKQQLDIVIRDEQVLIRLQSQPVQLIHISLPLSIFVFHSALMRSQQ
jgi:hypothetical protein